MAKFWPTCITGRCSILARSLSVSMILLGLASPSLAMAQRQIVSGAGAQSCENFLQHEKEEVLRQVHLSWVQGFLSGMNLAEIESKRTMALLPNSDATLAYLVFFCNENKDSRVMAGALALFHSAERREANEQASGG